MPRTYAARYTVVALIIGGVFVCTTLALEVAEATLPLNSAALQRVIGWGDLLVMTTPLSFGLLAYLAGRQRDRVDAQTR